MRTHILLHPFADVYILDLDLVADSSDALAAALLWSFSGKYHAKGSFFLGSEGVRLGVEMGGQGPRPRDIGINGKHIFRNGP